MLDHPSIAGRIQLLEQEVQAKQDNIDSLRNDFLILQERGRKFRQLLETVLRDGVDKGMDLDTLGYISTEMDMHISSTKTYRLNITMDVSLDIPLGETAPDSADLEYDISIEPSSIMHEISDYDVSVIDTTEV